MSNKDVESKKYQWHFGEVCRSAKKLESIGGDEVVTYLGSTDHPPNLIKKNINTLNGSLLQFKVDTSASVTAMPETKER